jgi:DnaJ-class molecular chaperone
MDLHPGNGGLMTATETECDRCEAGTLYNDEGYPDYPAQTVCERCSGAGRLVTFSHDCGADTTLPDDSRIEGCTFDCQCGRILLIDKGEAVELLE